MQTRILPLMTFRLRNCKPEKKQGQYEDIKHNRFIV